MRNDFLPMKSWIGSQLGATVFAYSTFRLSSEPNSSLPNRIYETFSGFKLIRPQSAASRDTRFRLRAYYYFIRPHMTLSGRTPTEDAEINLDLGENKRCSITRKATTRQVYRTLNR